MIIDYLIVPDQETEDAIEALNADHVGIAVIGFPINNPTADTLGHGTLVGKWVIPASLLTDPLFVDWYDLIKDLEPLTTDSDNLFKKLPFPPGS